MLNSRIPIPALVLVYLIAFFFLRGNFDTPYLHFDEGGQFFISKGLNHDADPLAHPEGIAKVIENNAAYNLDPGGFSVALHFWSGLSNWHFWLRMLPLLFFLGFEIATVYLFWSLLKNFSLSLTLGLIPLFVPMILTMAFEIRGYSMECLGTVLGVIALESLKKKTTTAKLLVWSFVLGIFLTSRYSEAVVVFVVSLFVVNMIYRSKEKLSRRLLWSSLYAVPLFLTLGLIYYFALRHQNKHLEPINYLPYIKQDPGILLAPANLTLIGVLVFLCILVFWTKTRIIFQRYQRLFLVTVGVNVLFIILSALGMHPWSAYSNRCVSLLLLAILSIAAVLGELGSRFLAKLTPTQKNAFFLLFAFGAASLLYVRRERLAYAYDKGNSLYNFLKADVQKYQRIFVESWESPSVRYLFEYDGLKEINPGTYPAHFTFMRGIKHSYNEGNASHLSFFKSQPAMNELTNFDLLITPVLHKLGGSDKWKVVAGTEKCYIPIDAK